MKCCFDTFKQNKFDTITQILRPFICFTTMQLLTKATVLFFLFGFNTAVLWAQSAVFTSGTNNYASFRIPAIIKAPNGDLLAFCEGRVNNSGDFGNIDIVMKRSVDGGNSWSAIRVVVDADSLQAGNPAPVVDLLDPEHPGGRIFLFYNTGNNHEAEVRKGKGERKVVFVTSTDNGKTWGAPVDISAETHRHGKAEDWRSYANTPGHALQLERGKYKGRIYVAANHSEGAPKGNFEDYRAHGFYSDDHGKTFSLSKSVGFPGGNESTAAELSDGRLMMNSRNQRGDKRMRIVSVSEDGGNRWASSFFDSTLIDPVCQGSVLNIGWKDNLAVLAFSNSATANRRDSLVVRVSLDEGVTWKYSLLIDHDPDKKKNHTAYSDLVLVNKKTLGVLYERNGYKEILFQTIQLKKDFQPWKK
jgi:sialidase-1